jgi:hypothetical protein
MLSPFPPRNVRVSEKEEPTSVRFDGSTPGEGTHASFTKESRPRSPASPGPTRNSSENPNG